MTKLVPFEFEFSPSGKPKFFATAYLAFEGTCVQWSVDHIKTPQETSPADRIEMEVFLREWKASDIAKKFAKTQPADIFMDSITAWRGQQ